MPVRLNVQTKKQIVRQLANDRIQAWLKCSYNDNVWIVEDSVGEKATATISFEARMPDGQMLADHPSLLATAKELVYWIRAGSYTKLYSAKRHAVYGDVMVRLCYGLLARGFKSFADLNPIDIERMCDDAARGVDGLTSASKLVQQALSAFQTWEAVPISLLSQGAFNVSAVIEEFKLPEVWARKEIKSELDAVSARLDGKTLVSVAASKTESVVVQQIHVLTNVFEALYSLRYFIEATAIKFRPFPEGASQKASDLGSNTNPTPIAHPDLVFKLLEGAATVVAEQHEELLVEHQRLFSKRIDDELGRGEARAFRERVDMFVTACYILIAAFTARRAGELKMLHRDCLTGTDGRGWWMKVYIKKTERKRTWIPIPPIVAKAVKAIQSFGDRLGLDGKANLFEYADPMKSESRALRPEGLLNTFAQTIGAHEHADDNGEPKAWIWSTRQFRRFFAVLFFYRYKGKKEALAHHLRHFSMSTTDDYLRLDPDVQKIWQKELVNYQVEVARDLVEGRNVYTGPMGERLNKIVKRVMRVFRDKVELIPENMARYVVRSMKKHQLVLVPKLWVTCTCPRSRQGAEKAACRNAAGMDLNDVGPEFSAAGPGVCPGCPWALIANENLAYYDQELRAMEANLAFEQEPTIFAELQAAKIVSMASFKQSLSVTG